MAQIDLVTLTAIGTWVLVIGTLILMYWQTRQAQRLNSANAVMALRERYDTPQLRRTRRALANSLLSEPGETFPRAELLTFFELLGVMTHRKLLDRELVWNSFGGWVSSYYFMLTHPHDRIAAVRERMGDPLAFAEFEWLYHTVQAIDRKRLGPTEANLIESREEARSILHHESELPLE
ncbi:MAG: hypothetical protein L3K15_01840 [Thermoplasmata archaeon]|nr:hypothetical protein [Thermoplasmata archaeon]